MTQVAWPKVKQILADAMEQPERDRPVFVRAACGGEAEIEREVLSLLGSYEGAGHSLTSVTRAAGEVGRAIAGPSPAAGAMIGRYRVESLIGAGGMGSVFAAHDTMLDRPVALKVLHSALPSPAMRRRFDRESRVLARLQHPGIAQVYESGTHQPDWSGAPTPFFAMELVHGARPIDAWFREEKPSREALLRVVALVCEAVQFGHQKGVIHRDIKPANILIDAAGNPKVIDFGVARAVLDDGVHTRTTASGQLVGTLKYMSPEACSGETLDIDVRSDVYSLGVVLYELLAGEAPHRVDTTSLLDAVRVIREAQPKPLSSFDLSLAGDLATIVHKALSKEPAARYQSAAELGLDLQRFLDAKPILARPHSAIYHARLYARRNKLAVAAASLVALALVAGVAGLVVGLSRARAAQREAVLQSQRATRTSEFLINALRSAYPFQKKSGAVDEWDEDMFPVHSWGESWGYAGTPGQMLTARDIISLAADKVKNEFQDDPVLRADLLALLADSLRETGIDSRTADFYEEALGIYEKTLGPDDRKSIFARNILSHEMWLNNRHDRVIELRRSAVESSQRALGLLDPLTRSIQAGYAGFLQTQPGMEAQAEGLLTEQLARVEKAFGVDSRQAIMDRIRLGAVVRDRARGLELVRSAQSTLESIGKQETLLWCSAVEAIADTLSEDCATQEEAAARYQQARETYDRLLYPFNPMSSGAMTNAVSCYLRIDRADLAVPLSVDIFRAMLARYPTGTVGYFVALGTHARLLAAAGQQLEEAEKFAREAAAGIATIGSAPDFPRIIFFEASRAQALRKLFKPAEGLAVTQAVIDRDREFAQAAKPAWAWAFLYNERAECFAALGRLDEARVASAIALKTSREDFVSPLDQCRPVFLAVRRTAERLKLPE